MSTNSTRKHLFTFLVDVPEDQDDWDIEDIREQVGSGQADIYSDSSIQIEG